MSAIFYHNDEQKQIAEETMKSEQTKYKTPIVTWITKAGTFYNAEDYHQKYRFRNHSTLFNSLKMTDDQVITSHIASRLNGYLSGHGSLAKFEKEHVNWGINKQQADYVKDKIQSGIGVSCH